MYDIKFYLLLIIIILFDNVKTNNDKLPFDTVVSFGDANTDTGNVYNLTNHIWPLVPPYYQGRFTNGLIWLEKLGILNILNYAYGDATIDNNNLIAGFTGPNRTPVNGIRQQIVSYLTGNDLNTIDLSRTVYIIWAGANEYIINSSLTSDIVVATLLNGIYDLLNAQIKHLIIMNLPPLQTYPGRNKDPRFTTLVTDHNAYLLSNISKVRLDYSEISIKIFDLFTVITQILSNNSIPMLNKVDKCWDIFNYTLISQCQNPDEYVFIDDYHFTSFIHEYIANNIRQFILSSSSLRTSSNIYAFVCIFAFVFKEKLV